MRGLPEIGIGPLWRDHSPLHAATSFSPAFGLLRMKLGDFRMGKKIDGRVRTVSARNELFQKTP
jgi:hypothetical protein